jgi:tRNA (guanosine-2'-O-)-methyltransferase
MNARAIVERLGPFLKENRLKRMEEALLHRTKGVRLVLENLDDPHNVSALVRTADGLGIHHLALIEASFAKGSFALNRDVSKGSEKFLRLERLSDTWAFLESTAKTGGSIVSAQVDGQEFTEVDWAAVPKPLHVVLGNEHRGVSQLIRQNARVAVALPSVGMVQSYNVSVAGAMILALLHGRGLIDTPLTESERDETLARWLIGDVPASNVILKRHNLTPPDF